MATGSSAKELQQIHEANDVYDPETQVETCQRYRLVLSIRCRSYSWHFHLRSVRPFDSGGFRRKTLPVKLVLDSANYAGASFTLTYRRPVMLQCEKVLEKCEYTISEPQLPKVGSTLQPARIKSQTIFASPKVK